MDEVIATVNINIGLGKANPSLIIKSGDNLSELIDRLIKQHRLPKTVHAIILERVQQQLSQNQQLKPKPKEKITKIRQNNKNRSISPLGTRNQPTARTVRKNELGTQKENNSNVVNCASQNNKNLKKVSVSPSKRATEGPVHKKVDLRPSKSPLKNDSCSQRQVKNLHESTPASKLSKLFKHLTKDNPSNVKIMSPQYINLKGLNRNLLTQLQEFFQLVEEQEFDRMDEDYFLKKVEQLNFSHRFTKKEYDLYLH